MLKKRVIPVLLLKDGRMVKGRQFENYRDTGSPRTAVRIYSSQDTDELVFLDIRARNENRSTFIDIIKDAATEAFMPLTVGGGITSINDVRSLLLAGADKVVITSAAVNSPQLIQECAETFGSQCVVGGIDYRISDQGFKVWIYSGTQVSDLDPVSHAQQLVALGAGEIFLNCIDRDGMMQGFDLAMINLISQAVSVPVIACGGAGNFMHLAEAFQQTEVAAVACSSLFHFGDNSPIRARSYLRNLNIPMRTLK